MWLADVAEIDEPGRGELHKFVDAVLKVLPLFWSATNSFSFGKTQENWNF